MSQVPPQKCWACQKVMFHTGISDSMRECDDCGFNCCGSCLFSHVRKAHPKTFAAEFIPKLKNLRESSEYKDTVSQIPLTNNVIELGGKKP